MNENFLSSYDCVIYDFKDYGFGINTENNKEIDDYIKNDGGLFLVIHDHWDCSQGPLNLIRLEREINFPYVVTNKTKVSYIGHEIFKLLS